MALRRDVPITSTPAPAEDPLAPARGIGLGLVLSLPLWALIALAVRALFG